MKTIRYIILICALLAAMVLTSCAQPRSIVSIEKTATNGNVDEYTIYYSDGEEFVFYITNGKDGNDGADGKDGIDGEDGKDGQTPTVTIGENGNWYINGQDTGLPSKGEQGEQGEQGDPGLDGHNPIITIGTNGNWFVDGVDTGVKAQGPAGERGDQGEDGHSPTVSIGANGNWHIDGIDTGVSATGGEANGGEEENNVLVITKDDIESGGYSNGATNTYAHRIRVNRLIPVSAGDTVKYNAGTIKLMFNVVSGPDATEITQKTTWLSGEGVHAITSDGYLAIIGCDATNASAAISPDKWDAAVEIHYGGDTGSQEQTAGKAIIARFGGEGNDWSFVYLPEDYDPNRAEAYPLVIANHGNGWLMNGTPQTANWTDITMYMHPDAPGYRADRVSRYIITEDRSLWYSNPTIEAFLEAGYIVAGAQNYGDNLYGNDNCRQACYDFYEYMQDNYNVEDACFMIGASNGCMTTLNTAYLLGDRVKAVILQYPLTCLANQYFDSDNHRPKINEAYGISDEVAATITTPDQLIAVIGAEFDPLYANVENGVKTGYFPAVKIYYSNTDTTTRARENAIPLSELLTDSGYEVELVQVDADGQTKGHGHIDHFNPEEYVAWFEYCRNESK